MTILNTEKLPITLKHLTIVDCTLYRPIRSVTLVKSIGSAKPGKARVINFKARVKPEARALEKTGLFSITTLMTLMTMMKPLTPITLMTLMTLIH